MKASEMCPISKWAIGLYLYETHSLLSEFKRTVFKNDFNLPHQTSEHSWMYCFSCQPWPQQPWPLANLGCYRDRWRQSSRKTNNWIATNLHLMKEPSTGFLTIPQIWLLMILTIWSALVASMACGFFTMSLIITVTTLG